MDLITQLPEMVNGNTCIVVFVDRLSKIDLLQPPLIQAHMSV